MKRLFTISALLQAVIGALVAALVIAFAISAVQAWHARDSAGRVVLVAGISNNLFRAMQNLRVERGTVNTALSASEPVGSQTEADISALRAVSVAALDAALAKLPLIALKDKDKWVGALHEAAQAMAAARRDADAALQKPRDQRSADLSKSWIAAVGKLVEAIDGLSDALSDQINQSDPFITQLMTVKQLAWAMRDAAGTDRLTIGAAIASGKGLPPDREKRITLLAGRIETAWKALNEVVHGSWTPAKLTQAVAEAKTAYFTDLAKRRAEIVDTLLAGKPVAISGGEWVKLSNPGLASLIGIANTAFDLAEDYAARQATSAAWNFYSELGLVVFFLGFGGFIVVFVVRRVTHPMVTITAAMGMVARGDLSGAIPYEQRADEIGQLARALAVFRDNALEKAKIEAAQREEHERREVRQRAVEQEIANFETSIRDALGALGQAATEITSAAEALSATADQTGRQAAAVTSAAANASSNVQTVAAASEELSASVEEISRQVAQAAGIADQAAKETRSTDLTVQGLAEAAQRIGEVVQLINSIAGQTNLLALNATIEAARAGEAGKGFAVVASEVKSLATQTGKATDDIAAQVAAIQAATNSAVEAIKGVAHIIGQVNEISTSIASAVEEQGAATREITRNTQQAARGTQDAAENIAGVSQAAAKTDEAANQMLHAAGELNRTATRLRSEVDQFLAGIRAA